MKHRVKILSMLLSFVLVLSLLPGMTAWADGTVVTTADEFLAAVNSGGSMSLANDITLPLDDNLDFKEALIIDLNGHTLTVQGTDEYCMWVIQAPVTIRDGAGGGMISHPEDLCTFLTHPGGSLTLEGGTLEFTNSYTSGIDLYMGPFTMTGGTIKSAGYSIYREGQPVTISGGTIIGDFLDSSGDLTITGGSFSFDPSALLPDGYAAPKVGDYWVVGAAAYSVTLSGGAYATASGGATTQNVTPGQAMTTVTYTANSGYTFPAFSNSTTNGVTLTRVSDTEVTVSGKPTANVNITVPDAAAIPTYTVTYDANGGSGEMKPTKVSKNDEGKYIYKVESCGFTAPEGETFAYWLGSDGKTYRPGPEVEISANLTLTAQWKKSGSDGGDSDGGSGGGFDLVFNIPGADNSWEYVGGYVAPQQAYRVSLAPMQGGSAAIGLTTGESGVQMNVYPTTTVYVFPNAAQGYVLDKIVWSLIDGSASYDITEAKNFVMPAMDVVVYVTFQPLAS